MAETNTSPRSPRRRFPKISPTAFQHPMDQKALDAVKAIKGIDFIVRKVLEYVNERYWYINNIADMIQVSPNQCSMVYNMLVEVCEILDVEVPMLFLDQDPVANAFTFGVEKPFIVLQSGLIDMMTEDELFTIIAHEVGHIKCGHVLYKTVAYFLRRIAEFIADRTFGIGHLITGPILVAFYEWDRKSELSADRAGLVAVQNPDVVITTLMKLAGGSKKVVSQLNKEEFLRQAEQYRELDQSALNQFYKFLQVIWRSHPFPALRAREIDIWSRSTEYNNILNGVYPRIDIQPYQRPPEGYSYGGPKTPGPAPYSPGGGSALTNCPNCEASVDANATFCHICGSTIIGAIAVVDKGTAPRPPVTPNAPPNTPPPPKKDNTPRCRNCNNVIKTLEEYCPSCGMNTRMDW